MKKNFETPKLTIINFTDDDIIRTSSQGAGGGVFGEEPGDEGQYPTNP